MSAEKHDILARRWTQIIDWANNDNPLEKVETLRSDHKKASK